MTAETERDYRAFAVFLANQVLAATRPAGVQAGVGRNVTMEEALTRAEPTIAEVFQDRPRAEALVRHELGVTWRHLGEGERFGVGVRGSKGTAAINPLTVWKELHGVPMDVSPTASGSRENAFTASYRAEWAHFVAAVAGEAKVPALQDHVVLHQVVDAIYRSAQDGRDVVL